MHHVCALLYKIDIEIFDAHVTSFAIVQIQNTKNGNLRGNKNVNQLLTHCRMLLRDQLLLIRLCAAKERYKIQ